MPVAGSEATTASGPATQGESDRRLGLALDVGTTTLALYIMNTFTGSYDYGYASALAVISTLIMMVVAFVYIRFGKMGQTDN